MKELSTKISSSSTRWKVSKRFKPVSHGPWVFIYAGLRERMIPVHRVVLRIITGVRS